ncbi:MAG TPA: excisionase family DNA-binding protein [Dehalococcoidia bacterium]|nr:excisionase family DNA-binding protein [Dehalococcoidia bacterium]
MISVKAGQIRERVLEKVREAAQARDEEATAKVMEYARAVLVALAPHGDGEDVDLERLTLTTGTAARVLGLHPEYVRELIRRGYLPATKDDGEFRLALPDVVAFMVNRVKGREGPPPSTAAWGRLLGVRSGRAALWRQPPEAGEQPA